MHVSKRTDESQNFASCTTSRVHESEISKRRLSGLEGHGVSRRAVSGYLHIFFCSNSTAFDMRIFGMGRQFGRHTLFLIRQHYLAATESSERSTG